MGASKTDADMRADFSSGFSARYSSEKCSASRWKGTRSRQHRRLIIKALALQLRGAAMSKPLGARSIAIVSTYVSQSFNRYA